MQTLFRKIPFADNPLRTRDNVHTQRPNPRFPFSIFAILGVILFSVIFFASIADLEQLAPERLEKLKSLFKKIDEEAEQYALVAAESKMFPCLSCNDRDSIFLNAGEIWKYGVSINGVKGRYGDKFLKDNNLLYEVQYVGNMAECYKQEKMKIFLYYLLPENLKRGADKISRPPGNKYD